MAWSRYDGMSVKEMRDAIMARSDRYDTRDMWYLLLDMPAQFSPAFRGIDYVNGEQIGQELIAAGVVDEDKVEFDGIKTHLGYFSDDESLELCRRLQNYLRWKVKTELTPKQRAELYRSTEELM